MIGQTLGHYRILEEVGAGGMGVVYRARDEQLERDVALKVLPPGTLGDDSARRNFRKEALALAKLNHPNIETVFEFGSQDGLAFLAMGLIWGHTLREQLKDGRLKILDFGLARLIPVMADPDATRSLTQETGFISGTIPYMPPEQLRGEKTDARADVYSAGAVLYDMANPTWEGGSWQTFPYPASWTECGIDQAAPIDLSLAH